MSTGFDYGTDEEVVESSGFKNPVEGEHSAVLRSIIHCGMFKETYLGEVKKPFPQVIAVFELKDDEDFEEDGVTPLTIAKTFPLKAGDKAFTTKFRKALDPKSEASGFDEMIGTACQVSCKGGKEKNDDGTPKYINFGGISGLPAKFAKMVGGLAVEGVGHMSFPDLTKEAILELNPITHVADIIMKGEQYEGSKAQEIIEAIKKDNPEFAVRKKKDKTEETSSDKQEEVKTNLTEDEEF